MRVLNLTQHIATPEQIEAGVVDMQPEEREWLQRLLTFNTLPAADDIASRVACIEGLVMATKGECTHVMLGGAPFLMAPLEKAMRSVGLTPVYAFSKRVSSEICQPDGSVMKTSKFVFEGFVGG